MKHPAGIRRNLLAAVSTLLAASRLAAADPPTYQQQMERAHQAWIDAGMPRQAEPIRQDPDFGVDPVGVVNIHAYAFTSAHSTDLILEDGNGYRYLAPDPVSRYLVAPVDLPSGVKIVTIGLSGCLHNAGDLEVQLVDNLTNGQGSNVIADFTLPDSGCIFEGMTPLYLYAENGGHPLLAVIHWTGDFFDGSTKFNEVYIAYQRQVSPAPAMGHFNDVPANDPGFQYVEALAASGITGGCGGGNFCPDSPVTRRQMAIFLAKALGLHWEF